MVFIFLEFVFLDISFSLCLSLLPFACEHSLILSFSLEWVKKVEETVKVPFEYLEIAAVALFFLILYLIVPGYIFANVFTFYPALFLMIHEYSNDKKNNDKWLSFWIVYSLLLVLNGVLSYYIPFYNLIRLVAVTALYMTDYVEYVVKSVFPMIDNSFKSLVDLIHQKVGANINKKDDSDNESDNEPLHLSEKTEEEETEREL